MFAKISRKGQITIPKPIRERLKIENEGGVLFLVEENEVKLKGVPGAKADLLAGSLKKYAKEYVPLNKIREKTKGKIADEIAAEGISD
ncbi:MAG: AbrB/MazE/SpoVT family DNA-binding domain-containing protein [Deltaproteobacteria bacterium]|nr:AbrB/MazE/SpoVT family DNA-binding domain-containing protein [Deltaproteobacteria bacterium]